MKKKLSESERKDELALLVQFCINNTKYTTLNQLASFLNKAPATVTNWMNKRTDPLKMDSGTLYKMLVLRGWDLTKYIQFLLGEISKEDIEKNKTDLTSTAINLPLNEQADLVYNVAKVIRERTISYSDKEFV